MTRILILALILLTTGCASAGSTGSTKTATLRDEGSVHIGKLKMTNVTASGIKVRVHGRSEFEGALDSSSKAAQADVKAGNQVTANAK